MALSVLIPLEGLSNTRDLGGMTAADGRRIRTGKLLRSGHLCEASLSSLRYIRRTVGTVIDLRSESERTERPDPVIEGVESINLPVIENLVPGSAGGEMSNEAVFLMMVRDPEKARAHMINTYEGFVKDNAQVEEYSRFMRLLLREREKAVLWHCTAGKDRAGFASALVSTRWA